MVKFLNDVSGQKNKQTDRRADRNISHPYRGGEVVINQQMNYEHTQAYSVWRRIYCMLLRKQIIVHDPGSVVFTSHLLSLLTSVLLRILCGPVNDDDVTMTSS